MFLRRAKTPSLHLALVSWLSYLLWLVACSGSPLGSADGSGGETGNASSGGKPEAGAPSTWTKTMPSIANFAYFSGTSSTIGPRILVRGNDPSTRISSLHFEFLDAEGKPAVIDPDGDGASESAELDVDVPAGQPQGAFFVALQSAPRFDETVQIVAVTPRDTSANWGERKMAFITSMPLRAEGQDCDADGFDSCTTGTMCTANGATESPRCMSIAVVRSSRCNGAPVIVARSGAQSVSGEAAGTSAWDAPSGCASDERRGGPESTYWLRVTSETPSITLTTASNKTNFDTVVYVLPSCTAEPQDALGCNDDGEPPSSTLTLRDVHPGSYLVVVDSLDAKGGSFELRVTVP
ncbi:hypothetical protein AKJ09_04821 [Labilithrix luteola]|uniref:Uncharacterized protein n=1 Tax=Labilithrix luteola TaxID=1391654 RepID=A0A0K1PXB3_9BACT|nr:hypothetical protein [Labilithrix luteola]AKU98157.1 hypothetical protein AKJ09_04821 [Labilithrix luteola]